MDPPPGGASLLLKPQLELHWVQCSPGHEWGVGVRCGGQGGVGCLLRYSCSRIAVLMRVFIHCEVGVG